MFCRREHKARIENRNFSLLVLSILVLSACAPGIKETAVEAPFAGQSTSVIASDPYFDFNAEGAEIPQGVPLDHEIRIVLDKRIDRYSTLVESNFKLLSIWGEEVPGFISMKFAPNPLDSSETVSLVKFTPYEFLFPHTEYIFTWRGIGKDAEYEDGVIPEELIGVVAVDGSPLINGAFRFMTSDKFSNFQTNKLEILSFSPGIRIDQDLDLSISSAIGNAVTSNGNQAIRIHFKDPIFNNYNALDDVGKEIPKTDIKDFPALTIATVSDLSRTVDMLTDEAKGFSLDNWPGARDDLYDNLRGHVHTEGGRRVLVFELDRSCTSTACRYPKDGAQAVVMIIRGLKTARTLMEPSADPFIGAFIHVSGETLYDEGFPDIVKVFVDGIDQFIPKNTALTGGAL